MGPRQSKSYPPHHPAIDPNSDTGRNLQAVADAAAARTLEGAGDIFTPPVVGVTAAECERTADKAVNSYHDRHCPAERLEAGLAKVQEHTGSIDGRLATLEGKLSTATYVIPLLMTLGLAVIGGAWKLMEYATKDRPAHHSSISRDAGQSVGPSFSLIPSAQAANK
jgi:hypothetical protein